MNHHHHHHHHSRRAGIVLRTRVVMWERPRLLLSAGVRAHLDELSSAIHALPSGDGVASPSSGTAGAPTGPAVVASEACGPSHSVLELAALHADTYITITVPVSRVSGSVGSATAGDDTSDGRNTDEELMIASLAAPGIAVRLEVTVPLPQPVLALVPRLRPVLPSSCRFLIGDLCPVPPALQLCARRRVRHCSGGKCIVTVRGYGAYAAVARPSGLWLLRPWGGAHMV